MLRHAMSKSQTRLKTGSWLFCGSGTGSRQCPLTGREAVPVRTRQAWPHDQTQTDLTSVVKFRKEAFYKPSAGHESK